MCDEDASPVFHFSSSCFLLKLLVVVCCCCVDDDDDETEEVKIRRLLSLVSSLVHQQQEDKNTKSQPLLNNNHIQRTQQQRHIQRTHTTIFSCNPHESHPISYIMESCEFSSFFMLIKFIIIISSPIKVVRELGTTN